MGGMQNTSCQVCRLSFSVLFKLNILSIYLFASEMKGFLSLNPEYRVVQSVVQSKLARTH